MKGRMRRNADMLITVIYPVCKSADYYADGKMIASAVGDERSNLNRITIYEDGHPKYRVVERSKLLWGLGRFIPLISLLIRLLIKPTYDIYAGEDTIGSSLEKWIKPVQTFQIGSDIYKTYTHKRETFSIHKNGSQVALITKTHEPFFSTTSRPRSYSVLYEKSEPLWIIYMFCVYADYRFFLGSENAGNEKIIVFKDPYEKYTQWQPGK